MRVAVAMSGGVDSTSAALLLKEQGYEVLGLHMKLHAGSEATWLQAHSIAKKIGIALELVDLSAEFGQMVIDPFVAAYASGLTPSPCPECNRRIKMGLLYEKAKSLGCERLATGHYARIIETPEGLALIKGTDPAKDQSYFLFRLPGHILGDLLFPLGALTKVQVREWLRSQGIYEGSYEESQELCFIPDGDYRGFLRDKGIESRPGFIKDLNDRVIGEHSGIFNYTVGQRRGMGIPGPKPLYVLVIDPMNNVIVAGPKDQALVSVIRIGQVNVLTGAALAPGERMTVKIRSTAKPVWCTVLGVSEDEAELRLDESQSGVAPGQAAVLYDGERLVGGGWILPYRS